MLTDLLSEVLLLNHLYYMTFKKSYSGRVYISTLFFMENTCELKIVSDDVTVTKIYMYIHDGEILFLCRDAGKFVAMVTFYWL